MSVDGPPASGAHPVAPTAPSLVGQVLDNKYRLIKMLGEGGMGEVYAAQHIHIEKRVAVKVLKAEIVSNPEAVKRFQQEAAASSSIKHRNIIGIDDFGMLPDGRFYMYMELLEGVPLDQLIQQPVQADRLLNVLIQSCHGLAAAHAKGIVHRDMKPENIFVTIGPQGEDVPKLLDFGIAKVSGNDGQNHLTRTGTIFGTPFYMAPEQALGNPVDARTDVYAMGVIMYECFAGSLPFQGESFMGILTQHITTEPEPVAQRAAKAGRTLPMGLADVITRCMQKNPPQRFATMDELVTALVSVYRGIAGPGMSTYMEAFPVGSTQHIMAATPPIPLTSNPHAATMAVGGASGGYAQPNAASGPMAMPSASASASGMYGQGAALAPPRKSNTGLILALLAVVLVGGGIAVFLVLNSNKTTSNNHGVDPGSQVASDDPGSAKVPDGSGSHHGQDDPGNHGGSGEVKVGSHGSADLNPKVGSAGSAVLPPAPEPVVVIVMTSPRDAVGEVWARDKKLDELPAEVKVVPGTPLDIVIKAKGYKDKPFTLDGSKEKVTIKLERLPGVTRVPVSANHGQPPAGHPDCTARIVDPHDKLCQDQFCKTHPDVLACQAE